MGQPITRTYSETFQEMFCKTCGIRFFVPDDWRDHKIRTNGGYCCPNGHSWHYVGETDAERAARLERELKQAKDAQQFAERRMVDERTRHEKELKRIKKRSQAGVCQECHRTFNNVARHMATKHGAGAEAPTQ